MDAKLRKEIQILKRFSKQNQSLKPLSVGRWFRCTKCGNYSNERYNCVPTNCKPCHKKRRKEYYKKNKQKEKDYARQWGINNQKKLIKSVNKYQRKRYKEDELFKLIYCVSRRIQPYLKKKGWTKDKKFLQYLGCSKQELKNHIEKQWKKGMSWDNYGLYGWHIDHIIPISSAKTKEEVYKLCHYTNLQPLWAKENLKKSNKIF